MTTFAEQVYQVLVEECDAQPDEITGFLLHWPDSVEYRFIGNQGFGGKVWYSRFNGVYVTNYPETDTPERQAARERANARLRELKS
jgi:hypothetical protein